MSGHVPPRRGKRKGALAAFNEQNKQALKAKGKAKPDAAAFTYRDDPTGVQGVASLAPAGGWVSGITWAPIDTGPVVDIVHRSRHANRGLLGGLSGLWVSTIMGAMASPKLPVRQTTEPLRGFRAWSIRRDDGVYRLRSVTAGVDWDGPVLRGGGVPDEQIPLSTNARQQDHRFGIYAYSDPRRLLEMEGPVVGEIEMSGRVIVHSEGFRAEKAVIKRLLVREWALFELPGIVKQLQERYQCEVTTDPAAFYAEAVK